MASNHLPPQWRQRLMAVINGSGWLTGQFGPEQMRLLDAWQRAEGGTAQWNPLNTTAHISQGGVQWQGPDYNSTGVANYTKPTYGVMATAATLTNGFYNGILGWLQAGTTTAVDCVNAHADEFRTWGTDPSVLLQILNQ
jgi:hypothetical protein